MIKWRSQFDKEQYDRILAPMIKDNSYPTTVFVGAGLSYHSGYRLLGTLCRKLKCKAQHHTGQVMSFQGDWKKEAQTCKEALGEANYQQVIIDHFLF